MEMYAVTEDNFDLKKAVTEGKICPQGGMDADVWGLSSGLEIRMHQAFEDASVPEEMLLFFWIMQMQGLIWSERLSQRGTAFF